VQSFRRQGHPLTRALPKAGQGPPLLTTTAEYALRALAELANGGPAEAVTAADLSLRTGVPEAYLSKVLRRLVSHGLLHGTKGHGGGFMLARPARRIRFLEVLEAVDSMPATNRCIFGRPTCSSAEPCPLHPAWSRMKEAFVSWASTTTLAEVVERSGKG
jgi:Rrf2 family transcriptional regulator, iron-sulfur cluster assembly transcription factor